MGIDRERVARCALAAALFLGWTRRAPPASVQDPLASAAGCFDATQAYPTDRLVFTFPVSCLRWTRGAD